MDYYSSDNKVLNQYKDSIFRLHVINRFDNNNYYFHTRRAPEGVDHWYACDADGRMDSHDIYCEGRFEDTKNGLPECRTGDGEIFQSYRNCTDISVIVNEEDDDPIDGNTLVKLYHENWGQKYHQGAIRKTKSKDSKMN